MRTIDFSVLAADSEYSLHLSPTCVSLVLKKKKGKKNRQAYASAAQFFDNIMFVQ